MRAHPNLLAARHHVRVVGSPRAAVRTGATPAYVAAPASAALPSWLDSNSATWDASTGTLTVTGPATITADPGTDEPLVSVSGSAAALTIQPTSDQVIHLGSLALTNGGSAEVIRASAAAFDESSSIAVVVGTGSNSGPVLSIDSATGSTLGLEDNDLIVRQGATNQSAFLGGVSVQSPGTFAIGTLSLADYEQDTLPILGLGGEGPIAPLQLAIASQSVPVDPGDMLVKYTYVGPAAAAPGEASSASSSSTPSASSDSPTPASAGMTSPQFAMAYSAPASTPISGIAPADVSSVVVNANIPALAGVQRSMVNSIVYTFSEAVTLNATTAFSIAVSSGQTGTVPTLSWSAISPDGSGARTQWAVTFSGSGVTGGSIGDGVYDITLNTAAVTSEANPTVPAEAHNVDTFYRLYGDINGDGRVNNTDYNAFLNTYGLRSTDPGFVAGFDVNADGLIDNTDYVAFQNNNAKHFSGLLSFNPAALEPTSVAAVVNGSTSVTISWNGSIDPGVTGYRIQRWSVADNAWEPLVQNLASGATSYTDTTAQPDTAYEYQVATEEGTRTSDWSLSSNDVVATPTLTVAGTTPYSVSLSWNTLTNATGYTVLRQGPDGNFSFSSAVSSFTDSTVAANVTYTYEAQSAIGTATSPPSLPVTVTTPLKTGLAATVISAGEVDLAWTNPLTDVTGIDVMRSKVGQPMALVQSVAATATRYVDLSVTEGTDYFYELILHRSSSPDATSEVVFAPTPLSVINLSATAISTSEIDLAWATAATGVSGYQVDRSTDGTNWTTIASNLPASPLQYKDLGLPPDTDYFYRVEAMLSAGLSAPSDPAEVSTLPLAPAAPTLALAGDGINVTWAAAGTNDLGFLLERSTDGTSYSPVATLSDIGTSSLIDPTVTSYLDSALSDAITYYYRLSLQNSGGLSEPSAPASLAIPIGVPSGLVATVPTGSSSEVDLSWTNASDAAQTVIEQSTDGQTFQTIAALAGPVTQYADSMATLPGERYYYRVRASAASELSAPSNVASAITAPTLQLSASAANSSVPVGQPYSLTVSPQYESGLPDPITSLSINWGDGNTDHPSTDNGAFTHVYQTAGAFSVVATAQNAGSPVSASLSAQVNPILADLLMSASTTTIQPGSSITLIPSFYNVPAGMTISGWTVDWDDGNVQTIGGSSDVSAGFTHTYGYFISIPASPLYFNINVAAETSVGVLTSGTNISANSPDGPGSLLIGNYVDPITGVAAPLPVATQPAKLEFQVPKSLVSNPSPTTSVSFGDGGAGQASMVPAPDSDYYYYYAAAHTYAQPGIYFPTGSVDGVNGAGRFVVGEEQNYTLTTIADQAVVPGDSVTVSTTATGLQSNVSYFAYVDWHGAYAGWLGDHLQPANLVNNDDGTATITATLANAPEGDVNPIVILQEDHWSGGYLLAATTFGLHAHYLSDLFGMYAGAVQVTGEGAARAAAEPTGKLIGVDNQDLNGNGIPDFAEGFGDVAPPTAEEVANFVPMMLLLPAGWDPTTSQIKLSYSGSDPAGLTRTGSGTRTDPYLYHPASGTLRIWDKNENTARQESDYLAPGTLLNASNFSWFQWGAIQATLVYVEAVGPSQSTGDQTISVQMIKNATADEGAMILSDSVKATAIQTTVAVDANRDGTVQLNGADETSTTNPYQFWLNDGMDSTVWNGDQANYETSAGVEAYHQNYTEGAIVNQSDLENFAHLEIQVPLGAIAGVGDLSPGWSATIQYVPTSGDPAICLVPLYALYATSMLAYMNDPTAARAMGGIASKSYTITGERVIGTASSQWAILPIVEGTDTGGTTTPAVLNYLFEGATAGSGSVVVSWLYNGNAVVQNSFNLQLQTITQMYEQASVEYQWLNTAADSITLGDLRNLPPNTIPSTAKIYNQYSSSSTLDNQVVVFVPGWRMKPSEQESYADTAFKRLYWQGYTGRFISFLWPTEWVDTDNFGNALGDPTNFDRSLQKAFNSAPALYNLLVSLDGQYGYQNVNIFAHSMGNFVVSEALSLAATQANPVPVANTYVATQSAVPAEAYDPSTGGNSGDGWANSMGTGQAYFANLSKVAVQNMYNFYNPTDRALTHLQAWPLNNSLKVDRGYDVSISPDSKVWNYYKWSVLSPWRTGLLNLADPPERYEAFAFAAHSASGAVGATANVGGPFKTTGQVDLHAAPYGFDTDHSGEFDGTESWRRVYWNTMMTDFGLTTWKL